MFVEQLESRRVFAAFQTGSFAVYRVGDGTAALTNAGTAVFVDEYSPTGTLLQSIALPTTVSGAQRQLVASGTATSEGMLTRSTDGNYLVLTGYDAAVGTAGVVATTSAATNRVVGRIDGLGVTDTTTALADAPSGNNIRGVASTNGTDLWISGAAGGVRYTTLGATTGTQVNTGSNTIANVRAVEIYDGQLYFSTSSGSAVRIGAVGTGTPTTAPQNTIPLPGHPTSGSPYQFYLTDLTASVAGVDTLYVADDTPTALGGILKYSLVGGSWVSNGSISGASGAASAVRGLTGISSGSTVTLVGTSQTALFTVVDTSGYNSNITATPTTIATSGTNKVFRGVALSPVANSVQVGIAAQSATKLEGNAGTTAFTFNVTRTGPTTGTSSVDYAVSGATSGSAADAVDFSGSVFPSGTVNFAIGETSKTITMDVVGDTTNETDEGFTVTLSNPVETQISTATASGTIQNDDASTTLAIDATDASKAEGTGISPTSFTFTVTRSGPSGTTTVDFAVIGAGTNLANATDFDGGAFPTGTVTFNGSDTSATITMLVSADSTVETDEGFQVTLSNPSVGSAIITGSALGAISNDDSIVAISSPTTITQNEGNSGTTTYSFTLTRTGTTTGTTDVAWSVAGTSTTPVDATDFIGGALPSGTVSFAAGELTKTVVIDVQGDTTLEPNESFSLTLNSATNGASVGVGTGTGVVSNDDFQSLSAGDLVITAINGDNPDEFSFVPLVDLLPGSTVVFTDNPWTGTALGTNEGYITYTASAGGLAKGTKIVVDFATTATLVVGTGTVVATSSFGLSTGGDNLFAYTGASTSPNFLFSVTTWGEYLATGGVADANKTFLPPGLVIGTSAVDALGPTTTSDIDNSQYDHAAGTAGSPAAIRALVADRTNWVTQDTTFIPLDATDFTLTGSNSNPVVAANSAAVSGNEGATITNAGTWSDPDSGDVVTLTASVGTIVKNANGTWDWSLASTDQIAATTVTITANDGVGGTASTSFTYTVNNVAPALTRTNASLTGNVGTTLTNTGTYSDVAADTVTLTADIGTIVNNGNGTWSWSIVPTTAVSNQTVTVTGTDEDGGSSTVTFTFNARSTVSTRGLFYSGATGASASANLSDKVALLPGQTSTFANYSNYSRGLNGLVVDVAGLPAGTTPAQMLASLQFASWNGIAAGGFVALPGTVVPTVTIVSGGGAGGSARVRITFADNAVQNTWLQVTVVSNANTGLAANDVFYFGSVLGELDFGNTATRLRVNGQDAALILANQSPGANSAPVTNKFDLDRNGRVNGQDYAFLLANQQAAGIVAPITAPSARAGTASRSSLVGGSSAAPIDTTVGSSKSTSSFDRDSNVQILNTPATGGAVTAGNSAQASGQPNKIDLSASSDGSLAKRTDKGDSGLESLDAFFASLWNGN